MNMIGDILSNFNPKEILKIKAGANASIAVFGKTMVDFRIDGFHDEDHDGDPEFKLDLDLFGFLKLENQTVEIPLNLVTGGLFGTITKVLDFVDVFDILGEEKKKTIKKRLNNLEELAKHAGKL